MSRKTKAQRIKEKVDSGMTRLDAEIAVEQEDYDARMQKLEAAKAEQDQKINDRILELLEDQHGEIFADLKDQALVEMRADEEKRSRRARAAAKKREKEAVELPDFPVENTRPSEGFTTRQG